MDRPSVLEGLHAAIDAAFAQRSAELAQRAIELDQREADLASAAELLAVDRRVSAALAQGQAIEQKRILTLIAARAAQFSEQSSTRLVLLNLRQAIAAAE